MARIVIGVFDDYGVTDKTIDELVRAGLDSNQISVLGSEPKHAANLLSEIHPKYVPEKLAKFIVAGALSGGLIGFAFTNLPGSSPIFAASLLFATLSCAAAGSYLGFLAGTLTRTDIDIDEDDDEATLTQGRVLLGVSVSNQNEERKALQVFDAAGAMSVHERAGYERAGYA